MPDWMWASTEIRGMYERRPYLCLTMEIIQTLLDWGDEHGQEVEDAVENLVKEGTLEEVNGYYRGNFDLGEYP